MQNEEIIIPNHIKKHLEKNKKLVHLYYFSGRPIFNNKYNKKHMIIHSFEKGTYGVYI